MLFPLSATDWVSQSITITINIDPHVYSIALRIVAGHDHPVPDVHRAVIRPDHRHCQAYPHRDQVFLTMQYLSNPQNHPHKYHPAHSNHHLHLPCGKLGCGIHGDSKPMPGTHTSLSKVHTLSVDKLLWLITPSILLPDISLEVIFIVASCNDESTIHNHAAGDVFFFFLFL